MGQQQIWNIVLWTFGIIQSRVEHTRAANIQKRRKLVQENSTFL